MTAPTKAQLRRRTYLYDRMISDIRLARASALHLGLATFDLELQVLEHRAVALRTQAIADRQALCD